MQVSVQGARNDVELRSLYRWLRAGGRELQSSGITVLAPCSDPGAAPGTDEMGGAFEVIQFVINSSAQLGALAISFLAWREAHGSRSSVTFEHRGARVTLTGTDLQDTGTVLRALEQVRAEGERE